MDNLLWIIALIFLTYVGILGVIAHYAVRQADAHDKQHIMQETVVKEIRGIGLREHAYLPAIEDTVIVDCSPSSNPAN